MADKSIRKHSWSSIFGSGRDSFPDDSFHVAAGSCMAPATVSKPPRLQAPARRDGKDMRKAVEDPMQRAGEEKVRKNALELRRALGGNYPGDAPETRRSGRSSSTVSSRQSHGMAQHDVASATLQRDTSAPGFGMPTLNRSRYERSPSVAPYPGSDQFGLPTLSRESREYFDAHKKAPQALPFQSNARHAAVAVASDKVSKQSAGKCDKCDGPHSTDACPHYKKPREKHKDAWANYGNKRPQQLGATSSPFMLRNGRCVRQPGDGNCLFHSLCFGLNDGRSGRPLSAGELRGQLASFIAQHPNLEIAGDTLEEWVKWDTNSNARTYASRMARGGWGGGIEMAACSLLKNVNVHVFERGSSGFKRISCFDYPGHASKTIYVLYQGGVHYDALVPL